MKISIIIPIYNEADSLPELWLALLNVLKKQNYPWEVVFVDDGSTDNTFSVIQAIIKESAENTLAIKLRRNFGQTAAIAAGIDHSDGEIIILMDADLQNDPTDIPLLMEKINQGYDVVSGWRRKREDRFLTRTFPSRIANSLISWVTGVKLHDYGCTLKAYRREIITGFRLYGEMHRFIPAYAGYVGAKIAEVPVNHHSRKFGTTNYGLERILKVILDLFTVKFLISYSHKPIYLFGGVGILLFGIGTGILLFLGIRRLSSGISPYLSPLFPASIMFALMGFQSILMGLIAELLSRTYHEAQGKPTYTIQKII